MKDIKITALKSTLEYYQKYSPEWFNIKNEILKLKQTNHKEIRKRLHMKHNKEFYKYIQVMNIAKSTNLESCLNTKRYETEGKNSKRENYRAV